MNLLAKWILPSIDWEGMKQAKDVQAFSIAVDGTIYSKIKGYRDWYLFSSKKSQLTFLGIITLSQLS